LDTFSKYEDACKKITKIELKLTTRKATELDEEAVRDIIHLDPETLEAHLVQHGLRR
jgi:hypothetical protein